MIKTFAKKPIKVQAVQWTGYNFDEIMDFVGIDSLNLLGSFKNPDLVINTLEGDYHALVGDWIIRGINGEYYPCKPDIFEKTYEEVTHD